MRFGPSCRPKVMEHLHQNWVQQDTYKKRTNRCVQHVKTLLQSLEHEQLSMQVPDYHLTNNFISDTSTISKEATELVTLVTYLVQKTGAYAWVVFQATSPSILAQLKSI